MKEQQLAVLLLIVRKTATRHTITGKPMPLERLQKVRQKDKRDAATRKCPSKLMSFEFLALLLSECCRTTMSHHSTMLHAQHQLWDSTGATSVILHESLAHGTLTPVPEHTSLKLPGCVDFPVPCISDSCTITLMAPVESHN